MSKTGTDHEIISLKKKNWILQEQLSRLEKDVHALSELKERIIVVETFLRVRFPDFPAMDRSFGSYSKQSHSHYDQRNSSFALSSSHTRDSPVPSRILGLRTADSIRSDEDEDEVDRLDNEQEVLGNRNSSRSVNEMDIVPRASGSQFTRPEDRNLDTAAQAKVSKWLNTHNIDPNADKPKPSSQKSVKRRKTNKTEEAHDQPEKKIKRSTSEPRSSSSNPPRKCLVKVNGVSCKRLARKGCDICGIYICVQHRFMTITCPNYLDSIKDCFKDCEKSVDSPCSDELYSQADKPDKDGMGRCVCCTGGKRRKVSRTRCQTCKRYICADHQVKTIRCETHRHHSLVKGLDSDYDSSSVSSARPDIIDHIDAI